MPVGSGGTGEFDVAVVGAGAAGLAAARHLQQLRPGLRLVVLEAGRRVGGRAYTVNAGPHRLPVDLGCGWLHGGRDNAWMVIAARTGHTIDHAPAFWDGGKRDYGLPAADAEAASGAIRAFFERADTAPVTGPDRPLSDLLEPGNRWNGLLGAIGTFVNGAELDRASLHDYQRYDPGRGPDPRVRDGYGRLVAAYGAGLPVALDAAVDRIDHRGRTLAVSTRQGTVQANAVVVTVPTGSIAGGDIAFDPPLPGKVAAAAALPLGLADKLFLGVPDGIDLPAEHHVMGRSDDLRTGGYHIRPFGRPVIECYYGGQLAHDLERAGRKAGAAFAREELGRFFGADVAGRLELIAGSAWAGMAHIHGSYSYAVTGGAGQRAVLAEPVDGRLFFAGEACSPKRFSTAHGAYETGVAAAEAVAAAIRTTSDG